MAGSRAAASVSLTIGVAVVTLLVAGGILAGPAILECSHQPGGIGACLRAKVQDAGLLPDTPSSSSAPAVSLQTSTPSAEARPQGWLEANATEYETSITTGSAELSPPIGTIGVGGTAVPKPSLQGDVAVAAPIGIISATGRPAPAPDATADVALTQPSGQLSVAGQLPTMSSESANVALAEPQGRLDAAGRPPGSSVDRAQVALAQPAGRLDASGTIIVRPDGALADLAGNPNNIGATGTARPGTVDTSGTAAVAAPTGRISLNGLSAPNTSASALADPVLAKGAASITGSISSAATDHGSAALEAEAEIPEAIPAPVIATLVPPVPKKAPPKLRPPKAAVVVRPPKSGPKRVFKADPRYPNVIALPPPPPIAASNSSFATLELR